MVKAGSGKISRLSPLFFVEIFLLFRQISGQKKTHP